MARMDVLSGSGFTVGHLAFFIWLCEIIKIFSHDQHPVSVAIKAVS
jgi:hypothetical protein